MSHAVVRGQPTAAQLYLDTILDELLLERGLKPDPVKRESVSLSELMFHCLKRAPKAKFVINGATGEVVTNEQILKRAVSLARALIAAGAKGKHVMLVTRNHQHELVVYLAVLFAGMEPFFMDPNTTVYEMTHFLNLIEPAYVFYDQEHHEVLLESMKSTDVQPSIFVVDKPEHLMKFIGTASDDINSFQVGPALPDDTAFLLPTSGSTGLPKAAALTHKGTVAQLPTIWAYHTRFPTPTDLVMVLTSIQWATFTMMVTTCIAYHIPFLVSPKPNTPENVIELIDKFRPTWVFFAPAFASALVPAIKPDQMTSLESVTLLGAPSTPELKQSFRDKLPKNSKLVDGYGSTEAQGFIILPDPGTPMNANGPVINSLYYKIVDDDGQELGKNQTGELWVKGSSVIKKYHKNDISYDEAFTPDGWYKTGDAFHVDENERLTFIVRKKFSFKFRGCQVAPEEVERVIFTVPGVHESIVCATDNGPAAAIVKHPNAEVTEEQIHQAVNAALSDHKRLHGGIIFVDSLPHTNTGKINRREASKLILNALSNGQERCY